MKVAGLFSGGKDSTYSARKAQKRGHELAYLVSMKSNNPDSYMFHTVNIHLTRLQAKTWGINYFKIKTLGIKEKEILDLRNGLSKLDIDGVVSGAIASQYQKERVDQVCKELGLKHFNPLWGREPNILIKEMINQGIKMIFSAVAAQGLDESWLGELLDEERLRKLVRLNRDIGIDITGEGGEYESFVIDAPWFKERIKIIKAKKSWDGISGRYHIKKAILVNKT
jgi:ABC transporter with metal-binding/Fe-S-binding domain ATP-binding protein